MNATYSPEDNKLRLYAGGRLDPETYDKVKAQGFKWAPKQGLFVAPAWSPSREDLLTELCGEIGDEDTSLTERAEERADRFEEYSEHRAEDAERAHRAISAIADNIPLGQPILVGHHSERHARKDAARIENGMRKAVKAWETSKYWESRAEGAIRHAKYKELPAVRARRIKTLEADKRKWERDKEKAENSLKLWSREGLTLEQARTIANYANPYVVKDENGSWWHAWDVLRPDGERYEACPSWTVEQVQEKAKTSYPKTIAYCDRWINHLDNRLLYEKTMLADSGGIESDRTRPEKGGACKCWAGPRDGWAYIQKVNKVSVTVLDNWGNGGNNFTRNIPFDKLAKLMTAQEVQAAKDAGKLKETEDKTGFFLLQSREEFDKQEPPTYQPPEPTKFDALKDALKEGIKTVVAPQLFPTPPAIAARMVELAEIEPGMSVLEPSAGTGNILQEIMNDGQAKAVVAVEINHDLTSKIQKEYPLTFTHCMDFLEYERGIFPVDRIIMNPPFENAVDIKHINHALTILKPGGKLVALCANGPRQQAAFKSMADYWEDLPAGSFKEQGTGVNVALMVINS